MITDTIAQEFQRKVCEEIRLLKDGDNRFRVFTPFRFDDGDCLSIVFKKENSQWLMSDEGHTYLHLSYKIDFNDLVSGTRREIIESNLNEFQVEDRYGELIVKVQDGEYGDALYRLIQALIKISDISYLSRERVKSTFYEDFKALIEENIPKDRYTFDWCDSQNDPEGVYEVDCYINKLETPLYIFALANDNKVRDTTISLLQFEKWKNKFYPVAIFQNESKLNNKVVSKFSRVCEQRFSNLEEDRNEIINYFRQVLSL